MNKAKEEPTSTSCSRKAGSTEQAITQSLLPGALPLPLLNLLGFAPKHEQDVSLITTAKHKWVRTEAAGFYLLCLRGKSSKKGRGKELENLFLCVALRRSSIFHSELPAEAGNKACLYARPPSMAPK